MITSQDTLPIHPGFAMGNIIRREDLYLPILQKRREALESTLVEEMKKKTQMLSSETYALIKANDKTTAISMMHSASAKINQVIQEHKLICQRIGELGSNSSSFSIEEMLPIDMSLSKMQVVIRGFSSERTAQLTFIKLHVSLNDQVSAFLSRLLPSDLPSSFLNSTEVESMTKNIGDVISTGSKVYLVGSFISLPYVRVYDPLVIRNASRISDDLKKRCKDYYVLTEAVLGAVFIGFGSHSAETEQMVDTSGIITPEINQMAMSKISMLSFICQGAIPKINSELEEVNLLHIYRNFKKILLSDKYSGYPTGYKFRELQDVLIENGVSIEITNKASPSSSSSTSSH